MTIEEYENKYVHLENIKNVAIAIKLFLSFAIIILLYIFISFCLRMFSISIYAGVVAVVVSIVVIIFCFVIPIYKLFYEGYFSVNVTRKNVKEAKIHNDRLCVQIAKGIIDINKEVPNINWYEKQYVDNLIIALDKNDKMLLRENLTYLINGSIKKASNDIIVKSSVKSGVYSVVSRNEVVDAILIFIVNIKMIKDIVFLYGFRPSMPKMIKILRNVLLSVATAYGIQMSGISTSIGKRIVRIIKDVTNNVGIAATVMANPAIGVSATALNGVLGFAVDASVQGLANGMFTAFVGYKTIGYLNDEYKLQEILDNIDLLDDEDELKETYKQIKKELEKETKKGRYIKENIK